MTPAPAPLQTRIDRPPWLPVAQWPFRIRAVAVDGHLLHLVDEGDGPVLLLVHAGMWSFVWRDLIADLSRDFRCVAVDFPGSGLTRAPAGHQAGLEPNSLLLDGVVDQLGLTEVTLVVHDLGSLIGLATAARRPELVRGLVVINGFGWPPRGALRAALRLFGGPVVRGLNLATNLLPRLTAGRFGVGRHLHRRARAAFLGPTGQRSQRLAFHQLMRDASGSGPLLGRIEAALRGPLADRPVLTVFGQFNDPFRFQRRWRELFPRARQVVVRRGNHFPMNDDPAGVAAAIRTWWHEVAAAPQLPGAPGVTGAATP
jgi:pimeloyl-ACP methyl ester carboxylesterase